MHITARIIAIILLFVSCFFLCSRHCFDSSSVWIKHAGFPNHLLVIRVNDAVGAKGFEPLAYSV